MYKHLIALLFLLFSAPVWAYSCPALMGQIDGALADDAIVSALNEDELAQVRELREQGEQYHNDGAHSDSEAALNEAKGILGI